MLAGCLDDATFDDLVNGRLSGDALRETETHLDRCSTCSDVVTLLAGGSLDRELGAGARVGRHRVLETIGRGAMGVVYLAHDPELDRKVALKLIRPGASAELSERMLNEARAMAKLAHPNVVAIYDVGREADGSIHLAMEWVSGCNLRVWTERQPHSVDEILAVYVQAGRGLSAAHRAGLVHRDFKPDNVLVGDDGRVRVTDFGLALAADSEATTRAGTPAYMAPEQHAGGEVTAQSDQFSFAVSLLGALSKKRVKKRVLWALARALSAVPEDRHPSLDALLASLEPRSSRTWVAGLAGALLLGAAGFALFASRSEPDVCGAGVDRVGAVWNPTVSSSMVGRFTAAHAELGASTVERVVPLLGQYAEAFGSQHRAICEATHVRHEQSDALLDLRMRCLDRGFVAFSEVVTAFQKPDATSVRGAVEATLALPDLTECAELAALANGDARPTDPASVARLERVESALTRARARANAGEYAEAKSVLVGVEAEVTALAYAPAAAEARLLAAFLARKASDFEQAARDARLSLSLAEGARVDRISARAWVEILAIDGARGKPRAVIENGEVASALITRAGDPVELRVGLLSALGAAHTAIGELPRAAEELERALVLAKQRGERGILVARTLTLLGNLARARGKLDEALRIHEQALAIDSELLGPMHPAVATHHHNVAGVLRLAGRRDDALKRYQKALEIEKRAFGVEHPSVALTENSIAIALIEKGSLPLAREHLARALRILEARKHPDRALVYTNLGITDAAEKRWSEAIDRFTSAIDVLRQSLGPDAEKLAGVLIERAAAERASGEVARANEDRKEAIRILGLHADGSAEAKKLRDELNQVPNTVPAARRKKVLGSTSYGSQSTWD